MSKALIMPSKYINNVNECDFSFWVVARAKRTLKSWWSTLYHSRSGQEKNIKTRCCESFTINYSKDKCHCWDVNDSNVLATDPPAVTLQGKLLLYTQKQWTSSHKYGPTFSFMPFIFSFAAFIKCVVISLKVNSALVCHVTGITCLQGYYYEITSKHFQENMHHDGD